MADFVIKVFCLLISVKEIHSSGLGSKLNKCLSLMDGEATQIQIDQYVPDPGLLGVTNS